MKKISISYDKEADVVYIGFGDAAKAVGEEIRDGVFARYDSVTNELAGLTILNFSKKFDSEPRDVEVPSAAAM